MIVAMWWESRWLIAFVATVTSTDPGGGEPRTDPKRTRPCRWSVAAVPALRDLLDAGELRPPHYRVDDVIALAERIDLD
jgi:hypothetical protein